MNAAWHKSHPMPKNPSLSDRVRWHVAHAKACGCREMPPTVLAELGRRRGPTRPIPRRRRSTK